MQITGLLLKAKIGRYLMRNGGGLDANIHVDLPSFQRTV